jgi:hypothetical protein
LPHDAEAAVAEKRGGQRRRQHEQEADDDRRRNAGERSFVHGGVPRLRLRPWFARVYGAASDRSA